jgi:hypothetical protein
MHRVRDAFPDIRVVAYADDVHLQRSPRCVVSLGPQLRLSGPVSRPVCGLGCGCLVRLRFALRIDSHSHPMISNVSESFVSVWQAFSSVSLCKSIM